jgi:ribose transport system substrate-binding protein
MTNPNVSRRSFQLGLLTAVAGLAAGGCGREQGGGGGKKLVGFSQANKAEPWRTWMDSTIEREIAKHPDLQLIYADAAQDNSKQVADVENFMRQGVDLLVISPNEARPLTGVVRRAFESGIPVVVLDRSIEGDTYTSFIGADNRRIGAAAGTFAGELLGGRGNVVEIKGLPGSTPAIDRSEGFRDAIKGFPDIKIIHDPVADWLRDKGREQMEAALQANEKIDLVYGHNDPMAMGAYLAAKAMGRDKQMKFIGIDGLPGPEGGAQAVLDGKLEATFLYPNCGVEAVDAASRILRGEQVPKKITLDTVTITKANAAEFTKA